MLNVISSITLMINLTWARKRSSFGSLNKDKTIVIVDYPALAGGMGDIIQTVQEYTQLVRKKGWIPVVRLNRRNQYLDSYEDNMWEYYFNNVSEVTLDEALNSYIVICGDVNNFTYLPAGFLLGVNPHANKNIKVSFNDSTQKYIKENVPHELRENKKVLGVIARGTDLDGGGGRNISRFVRYCRNEYDKGYDYIFLASEDEGYYEAFCNEFGDRLVCIPQERIKYDYQNSKYVMIAALFHWKSGERKAWGMKYLLITYCLSLCDSLLSTYYCGAWNLAHCWKEGDYVVEGIMAQNAFENIDKANKEEMCCKIGVSRLIADNSLTVIYGTGLDAQTWIPVNENTKDKIIFCDKKATEVQYKFKGIDVIKPMDIVDGYNENSIIIASTAYEVEIEQELIELGVDKERIRTLGQLEAEGERILRDKLEQDETVSENYSY